MKKRHFGMIAFGIGVAALIVALRSDKKPEPAAPVPALTVTATAIERRPLQHTLTATGSIQAWQELVVSPQIGGYRVEAVQVDIGSVVKKGQVLARLDSDQLDAEVQASRAALAKAQAQEQRAAAADRRGEQLAQRKLLSQADLERLNADNASARADTDVARANLNTAELNLRQASITAPSDGIISARSVNLGEIAAVGKPLFHLIRDSRLEWRAEVPESRLRELLPGQTVTLRTADGTALRGSLRSIDPTVDANRRNALVYVDLPQPAGARPGMFARGDFLLETTDGDTVPLAAVVRNDGYSYVFTLGTDNIVQRRRIETGAVSGDRIEVLAGLAIGQKIVHAGASFLKDGDRVAVVPANTTVGKNP